jgi:FMN phosphatase YigB (HAD superfamily)
LDTAIPGLLPYARTLLEWLAASRADSTTRIVSFLLSEGNPQRVQRIIRHYEPNSTGRFFDDVILVPDKDAATFSRIAGRGGNLVGSNDPIVVVIGDSLKRDIGPGNRIGAITIYKPAGFHGNESVRNAELRPDYEVADLDEARRVLVDLAQSKVPAPVSRTDRV